MWRQLSAGERARLLGQGLLGVSLVALALALFHVANQWQATQRDLPETLASVERIVNNVEPLTKEVAAVRAQIPRILREVEAVRTQVAPALAEAEAWRKALPPMVSSGSGAVRDASRAVQSLEPHIDPILAEVARTREAIPNLLERANTTIDRAKTVGQDAGSGAAYGVIGGILLTPFRLLGDIGKGVGDVLGLAGRKDFSGDDERHVLAASQRAIDAGTVGAEQSWKNTASGNRGSVRVMARNEQGGAPCVRLRYHVQFASGEGHDSEVEACRQEDGGWVQHKR